MELSPLKKWLILINVLVSVFMATLDGSIVNIALNTISQKLSVNISSIQWVVTSYLLVISVLLLIWGKISDLYGKKYIFAFGFIIFTGGSLMCGLSTSLKFLIFSRVIQAIGASAMMALSQGIVTETFNPGERGKALGLTGTTVAIGSLVGPSLGGILVHYSGWKSIFLINVPVGIIGAILTFVIIPKIKVSNENKVFDFKGSSLFVFSILLLFISLLLVQEGSINNAEFIIMFVLSIITLSLFIWFEKRAKFPLLDLGMFKIRIFSMGLSSAFLSFIAINSSILFMPFYLQIVQGLDPLRAGLLMSFYPAASAIVAPISGSLSDRLTYRPLTIIGLSISTIIFFITATLGAHSSKIEIAILMSLLGAGLAIFQSPNNNSIMGSVPRQQLGIAGGINALFRNLGFVSGTTLSVLLFTFTSKINMNNISAAGSSLSNTHFLTGFRVVIVFAALANLLSLIISLTRTVSIKSVNEI